MAIASGRVRESNGKPINFAHIAEAEIAAVLDHYKVEWEYEETTFVLARDENGAIARAFCPDLYLPAFDVYIEITTQKQKLVTKKHKKIRDASERYGINVILVNKSGVEMIRKIFARILDGRFNVC